LRRYRAQLEETGEVKFETAEAEAETEEYIESFIRLHQARWERRNEPGMLATERVRRFHRASAGRLASRGGARLHALRYNGNIAAVVYALRHGPNAFSYLGGFDPELARYSPGTLVMGYAIQRAVEQGVRRWDFLRGRENYKYAWGAQDRASRTLRVWHAGRPVRPR
jgi:CelD/BcsL family acetyltransferase involved in cellulose biosynthesis